MRRRHILIVASLTAVLSTGLFVESGLAATASGGGWITAHATTRHARSAHVAPSACVTMYQNSSIDITPDPDTWYADPVQKCGTKLSGTGLVYDSNGNYECSFAISGTLKRAKIKMIYTLTANPNNYCGVGLVVTFKGKYKFAAGTGSGTVTNNGSFSGTWTAAHF